MLGYTGHYRGMPVSVMGSGMGIPSCLIYATELVREFGARRLIRIGTCGAVHPDVALGDIVLALGAGTDSNVNRLRFSGYDYAALASFPLLERVARTARSLSVPVRIGSVFSSDQFYHPDPSLVGLLQRHGVLAIEMEAAGLYGLAAESGVEALAVLTVSDHLGTGARMDAAQREHGVDRMTRLVLESLLADDRDDAAADARASATSSAAT
jgi:purine-nucleoside phosphorylase